jgi:MFS transporter, FHS family, L-fucose permease
MNNKKPYQIAFILVTTLFFLWAFLHNINGILIPHLKKACTLSDTESALIDSAVYLGYFLIALPAGWFMHKYGYVNGILLGLSLYAVGAFLFFPAAAVRSFPFFLTALFVMASGATFLETVANPYVTKLGDPAGAAQRINFAQSFNGVGAFIAPLIGGQFIFSGIEHSQAELAAMAPAQLNAYLDAEAATVKVPYLVIGAVAVLLLLLFRMVRIPEIREESKSAGGKGFSLRVLRHRHLRNAVVAEFCYVGAQVCMTSFFVRYARYVNDVPEKRAAILLSIAMAGFMVGRFAGTFLMKYFKPALLLCTYAAINVGLLTVALLTSADIAIYAMMATPFFMSIMFPTIFALGISGLGEESKIASSLLVMSIVGGAFFPLVMGRISDATGGNIQLAYVVPVVCFLVILWFGFTQRKTTVSNVPADAHALEAA